jgi:hypothetical protein
MKLITPTFLIAIVIAVVDAQTCCSNGPYFGNIEDACTAANQFNGDGLCWNGYEIHCQKILTTSGMTFQIAPGAQGVEGNLT